MSEVLETGIVLDTYDEIRAKLKSDIEEAFGDTINDDNAARFGQLINIWCERIADQNDLIQAIVNQQDPTSATGVWLEQLVRINGISKNESANSTTVLQITANAAGTTVLAGDQVEVATGESAGEIFTVDSNITVAPSSTGNVSATAENPGSIVAAAGSVTIIKTPRYGWASVTNTSDAVLGALEESDQDLRIRRELAASQTGNSSVSALFRILSDLDNVIETSVYQNIDDETDELGVPAHSFWAILRGGTNAEIAEAIFSALGAGIGMFGNTTENYADPITGQTWPITWSFGVEVPIYIKVRTRKDTNVYPGDGDALMKQNVVDFFDGNFTINGEAIPSFGLGDDVESARIYTPCNVVPGHAIVEILISTTPTPTASTTIELTPEQYADTEIANIEVENVT